MAGVWITVLTLSAVLMGWATATHLRRAKPTEPIALLSWGWGLPRGGPIGLRSLGALGSGGIAAAALIVASDNPALALALAAGGTVLALLVQTVLLRRHNHRFPQRP